MEGFLRRLIPVIAAGTIGLIVGVAVGFIQGVDASTVLRLALQGAGVAGCLALLLRCLLLLVSLDPDKPRMMTRQKDSAHSCTTPSARTRNRQPEQNIVRS